MSDRSEVRYVLRQLLLSICRMERVTVAYRCACGQFLILTNFDPSALDRETAEIDVSVLRFTDGAVCPECGVSLAPVWSAAEMSWVKDTLAKLDSLDVESLVHALQDELQVLQEARLRCN